MDGRRVGGLYLDQPRTTRSGNPRLRREVEVAGRQIDQIVYELYGLTEEEIKIVEEGATE